MLAMEITPSTVIIGLVLLALVVFAIVRLRRRGMCDCKDCNGREGGCAGCSAADKMIADMDKAAKRKEDRPSSS